MKNFGEFGTLKERGEWAELAFMTQAARRGFAVCKPWGDSRAYDVGIEHGQNFLRVQVKSTAFKIGRGYYCQFTRRGERDYKLGQLDLFAAYVIPVDVWYLIPAVVMLGAVRKRSAMLFPVLPPVRKSTFACECYREAWSLLRDSRSSLMRHGKGKVRRLQG